LNPNDCFQAELARLKPKGKHLRRYFNPQILCEKVVNDRGDKTHGLFVVRLTPKLPRRRKRSEERAKL
jgi:hypothetical protein